MHHLNSHTVTLVFLLQIRKMCAVPYIECTDYRHVCTHMHDKYTHTPLHHLQPQTWVRLRERWVNNIMYIKLLIQNKKYIQMGLVST